MKDKTSFDGELAFVMRPITNTMATDKQAVVIGGLPRLPADLDWPRQADGTPTHFFAEIDLSRLPREHQGHRTPDFPLMGTLFIFLPLGDSGFHGTYAAQVLYTEASVAKLPERNPPDDLQDVLVQDPCYMHEDGMTYDGTVVLRRNVEVVPFFSPLPTHPYPFHPWAGSEEEEKSILDDREKQWKLHLKNIAQALHAARPISSPLRDYLASRLHETALPYRFRRLQDDFDISLLDWRFVYDWAVAFYRRCLRRTHKELRKAETTWLTKWVQPRVLRRLERLRDDFESFVFDFDAHFLDVPKGKPKPPNASEPFDDQAREWVNLALTYKGLLPTDMREAFVEMLVEMDRRADQRTVDGKRLTAGIDMLESTVGGSSFNAATTATYATEAFTQAVNTEPDRFSQYDNGLSQEDTWDLRLLHVDARSMAEPDRAHAVLGTTPLQMFGRGDAVQNAVDDHIGDVLLMQIGEAHGLPFDIPPDMVVHLWISPEDLAIGNFDRVETTIEMT